MGLHLPDKVQEVATARLDRVVRKQGISDPGDQGPGRGWGIAARGLERADQEGLDLGGGRGTAFQEVTPRGQEGRAGCRRLGDRRLMTASPGKPLLGISMSLCIMN
jgi:hypothetical protein